MPKYRVTLSDGRTFDVEASGPPSEQDVLAQIGPSAPAPSTPTVVGENPLERIGKFVINAVKNHPAQAGAMAGGMAAAPFTGGLSLIPASLAVGGASALGAGAGQLVSGQTPDAGTMGKEGVLGMLGQGVGRGVAAGAKLAAKPIARGVLKVSRRLQDEYGLDDILNTFFRERIPVGQSSVAGQRARDSAVTAKQMAQDAAAQGAPAVSAREIVREFRPLRDEVERRAANASPNAASEMREIVQRAKDLRRAGPKDVVKNQELKQQAQSDANKAFRAADRGAPVNDTTAKLDKAVAVGRQKAAETRIPGIAGQNKQTQELMALESALEDVEARSPGFMGTNPTTWLGAVMPGTGSKIAIGADDLSRAPLPGAFRNALLALLGGGQDQ